MTELRLKYMYDVTPRKAMYKCQCGNDFISFKIYIENGRTKSCGCWNKEKWLKLITIHDLRQSPLYSTWAGMKSRCDNISTKEYKNYGGGEE